MIWGNSAVKECSAKNEAFTFPTNDYIHTEIQLKHRSYIVNHHELNRSHILAKTTPDQIAVSWKIVFSRFREIAIIAPT